MEVSTTQPLLEVKALVKYYKSYLAVDHISFELYPNEIVGLLGTNGAGKSSIFKMIAGFLPWNRGAIQLGDVALPPHSPELRAKSHLAYMPQEPSIFRRLTVKQNLIAAFELLYSKSNEFNDHLEQLMQEFGLIPLANHKAQTLSGGERRRLELARCLAIMPKVLLLDEPFAGVDMHHTQELSNLIKPLRNKGLSILITDHNAQEILKLADRILLVHQGKIIAQEKADEILNHPQAHLYFSNMYH